MPPNARLGDRPTLIAVTVALVTVGAYYTHRATRGDTTTKDFVTDARLPVDAPPPDSPPVDSPPDTPPDTPPDSPPSSTWAMVTIHGPEASIGLDGADGVDVTTIGGNRCITTPWEQSNRVTVSCKVSGTWTSQTLSGSVSAVEDAKFCDINSDGVMDVVAAGQSGRMSWWQGAVVGSAAPTFGAAIPINAAYSAAVAWIQLACTTGRVWAGGRNVPASVGYLDIPATPTDSAAWTYVDVGRVGWTMSLVPIDMDGDSDLDLVISDRISDSGNPGKVGARWLENTGTTPWTNHEIHKTASGEGAAKFLHVSSATKIYDTYSSSGPINTTAVRNWNGSAWVSTAITQPAGVGQVHDVEPCDLDGDAVDDLVFTYSTATGSLLGVSSLTGAAFTTLVDIDGAVGEKYDNVLCFDMDGDGDLDILTSEQNTGLGLIYFANPRLP